MIDTKKAFMRLLKDLEESSPKFSNTLKEISPIKFCINIKGHRKIYVTIDSAESKISFDKNDFHFEIEGSLIELLGAVASKKIKRSLISGDEEVAMVLFTVERRLMLKGNPRLPDIPPELWCFIMTFVPRHTSTKDQLYWHCYLENEPTPA